jgi:hypothetical protein
MGPRKITFGDMREMGVRGVVICCADYHCSHSVALTADRWPDDLRLSDIEPRFVCQARGERGAEAQISTGMSKDRSAAWNIDMWGR